MSVIRELEPSWRALLRCPETGAPLEEVGASLQTSAGDRSYPVVRGVPVLIADERSLFTRADYLHDGDPPAGLARARASVRRRLDENLPSLTRNLAAKANIELFLALIRAAAPRDRRPRVLVVGGRVPGAGFDALLAADDVELVETDVSMGPRTRIVCDVQDLPFADGVFDAVSFQAVIDLIADPDRAVAEIHRVLAPGGLVYCEAGFMQQYHRSTPDYVRFTLLGHRRVYRAFDSVAMGVQCGPGMALAWSLRAYVEAWISSKTGRYLTGLLARVLLWWLPMTDGPLVRRPVASEAASGTFFLGRRRATPLGDREVLCDYERWRARPRAPGPPYGTDTVSPTVASSR